MLKQNKSYKVFRGSAAWYPAIRHELVPDDPMRWASTSNLRIGLLLYSDGTTRVMKRIVRKQLRIASRPDLLVLVCCHYNKLELSYFAVNNADWAIWEQHVQAWVILRVSRQFRAVIGHQEVR